MVRFLDLNKQYLSMKEEIDKKISQVIEESSYIGGIHLTEFESCFINLI